MLQSQGIAISTHGNLQGFDMDWKNNLLAPVITAVAVSTLFYFGDALRKTPSYLIPSGAVLAFDLARCPDGWKDFEQAAGRTVVGIDRAGD